MATKKKATKPSKKVLKNLQPQVESATETPVIDFKQVMEENKLLKEQLAQQQLQTSMSSTEIYRYQHLLAINNQTEVIRSGVNAIGSILSDLLDKQEDKDQDDEDSDEDVDDEDDEEEEK